MSDWSSKQEIPTEVEYGTLSARLDAIDQKIVDATFDIDTLPAAGALVGADYAAVSHG